MYQSNNYCTGSSATISACCHARFTVPNPEEHAKISLKKLVRKVENMVNVSYIYIATNNKLYEFTTHLFTFPYISGAGGFQPHRVCVCRNFTFPAGAFGFLLSTGQAPSYFLTSKSCES